MKIKHKVQRKLHPNFQAELRLCCLCSLTTWWHWVVCAGSRDGPWRWFSGAHLPGRCTCGVRGWVGVSASVLQWVALCCTLRLSADGRDAGGDAGSSGSGAEHPAPPSAGSSIEEPPGSPLLLWEPCFYSACVRASFGFVFLSQTVVPKIGNPRNHREADTDANTWGFI